jgi:hypothetical protein
MHECTQITRCILGHTHDNFRRDRYRATHWFTFQGVYRGHARYYLAITH